MKHITAAILRALAVEASADPRSVHRVLKGERVRGMAHDRIIAALERRGITPSQPPPRPARGLVLKRQHLGGQGRGEVTAPSFDT